VVTFVIGRRPKPVTEADHAHGTESHVHGTG
jgi:hypothetical protein